jgi:ATP-dependent RNA helicase RhlE
MSFCDAEEMQDWRNILKITGQKIPVIEGHPFPAPASGQVVINLPKNKDVVRRPNAVAGFNQGSSNNRKRFSGGSGRAR